MLGIKLLNLTWKYNGSQAHDGEEGGGMDTWKDLSHCLNPKAKVQAYLFNPFNFPLLVFFFFLL